MKKQGVNPYLPSWEYVPDGEPYIFGDRVYVYGSHDRFGGYAYCLNDYVCWSAPVNDLSDWRYEGIIYLKTDDPANRDGEMCLYAPDVTRGYDGRYYLYYVLDELQIMSVAVCDTPAGKYSFYGYVKYENGTLLGEADGDLPQFDPAVLCEDHKVYLYSGFCGKKKRNTLSSQVIVLREDMLTILESPRLLIPGKFTGEGTEFEENPFFEASSIRKIGDVYYFVYSSAYGCSLCYAVSKSPTEGFHYGGVIVSNNDVGIDSYKDAAQPMYYGGNNHGSIICIGNQWYVFYHRHTNGTNYSRQGCMEPIRIDGDGSIRQVEMTSCGPNGGPLEGKGTWPAYIACNLFCETVEQFTGAPGEWMDCRFPKITQDGKDGDKEPGYIANMKDGATAGFKYFQCHHVRAVGVTARGRGMTGEVQIMTAWNGEPLGSISLDGSNEWKEYKADIRIPDGVQSLYFRYRGEKAMNLLNFTLYTEE